VNIKINEDTKPLIKLIRKAQELLLRHGNDSSGELDRFLDKLEELDI